MRIFFLISFTHSHSIEFLRFLYFGEDNYKLQDSSNTFGKGKNDDQNKRNLQNENLAIKLIQFSDKYLQDDLREKCINFLQYALTEENVYRRLELAHKENLPTLEKWCILFLKNTMEFGKIFDLVEYLNKESQEFDKNNLPLQKIARDLVVKNYITIIVKQKKKIGFYDEFLAKNVRINTFVKLAKLPYGENNVKVLIRDNPNWEDYERAKKESIELLKQSTANLRSALFAFARENYEQLEEKKHIEKLPKEFLEEFKSSENQDAEEPKKGVKRMEPGAQNEGQEENPELKKTKK